MLQQGSSTTECKTAFILCFYSVFVPQLIGQDIGLISANKETKKGLVPPQQLISSGCMYIDCQYENQLPLGVMRFFAEALVYIQSHVDSRISFEN